ncbi:hypothetical protein [Dasineura jujubifolia toursvirus 2a]|nr:hypothetical protein [Dasineura jujubifolia toursvirus 2a]
MYEIYHETSFSNLESILKTGFLVTSSSSIKRQRNEGSSDRRTTKDPMISLRDKNFYEKYDEVDAVYLRFKIPDNNLPLNDAMFVFSKDILDNYHSVINTTENFGFMINKNGVEGVSQFSGDPGISIVNSKDLYKIANYNFDYRYSEIAIMEDVDISNVKHIYIRKKFQLDIAKIESITKKLNIPITLV